MHAIGKSDGVILSMKRANKGIQPNEIGQPPAEFVEKRPPAEGNTGQTTVTGTQGLEGTLINLSRVREAAKRDSKLQFSNLLHHVSGDLLRQSYWALNRQAATGVDDITWTEYGQGLEERLAVLHDLVQSERYQAKPSKRIWIPKSDGQQRPIGIASLEDKIVQQALTTILQQIYEVDWGGIFPDRHLSIYDPACGTGGMLSLANVNEIRKVIK